MVDRATLILDSCSTLCMTRVCLKSLSSTLYTYTYTYIGVELIALVVYRALQLLVHSRPHDLKRLAKQTSDSLTGGNTLKDPMEVIPDTS